MALLALLLVTLSIFEAAGGLTNPEVSDSLQSPGLLLSTSCRLNHLERHSGKVDTTPWLKPHKLKRAPREDP